MRKKEDLEDNGVLTNTRGVTTGRYIRRTLEEAYIAVKERKDMAPI
jgi:hypothetical protein